MKNLFQLLARAMVQRMEGEALNVEKWALENGFPGRLGSSTPACSRKVNCGAVSVVDIVCSSLLIIHLLHFRERLANEILADVCYTHMP